MDDFAPEFKVKPRTELKNAPFFLRPESLKKVPEPGKPLKGKDMERFIRKMTTEIAGILELEKK